MIYIKKGERLVPGDSINGRRHVRDALMLGTVLPHDEDVFIKFTINDDYSGEQDHHCLKDIIENMTSGNQTRGNKLLVSVIKTWLESPFEHKINGVSVSGKVSDSFWKHLSSVEDFIGLVSAHTILSALFKRGLCLSSGQTITLKPTRCMDDDRIYRDEDFVVEVISRILNTSSDISEFGVPPLSDMYPNLRTVLFRAKYELGSIDKNAILTPVKRQELSYNTYD